MVRGSSRRVGSASPAFCAARNAVPPALAPMQLARRLLLRCQAKAGVGSAAGDSYAATGDRGRHADGNRDARQQRRRHWQGADVCRSVAAVGPQRAGVHAFRGGGTYRQGRQSARERPATIHAARAACVGCDRSGAAAAGTNFARRVAVCCAIRCAIRAGAGVQSTGPSTAHGRSPCRFCPGPHRGCKPGPGTRCRCRRAGTAHARPGNASTGECARTAAANAGRGSGQGTKDRGCDGEVWFGSIRTGRN